MRKVIFGLAAVLLLGGACARRVEKSAMAEDHERWVASLDDSVAML